MGSLVWSSALKADGKLSDRDAYVMFHPADRRAPHMLIARGELPSIFIDNPGAYTNSIFMACVKETWSGHSKLPWGHNVRFVGEAGAIHAETKALLSENGKVPSSLKNVVVVAIFGRLVSVSAGNVGYVLLSTASRIRVSLPSQAWTTEIFQGLFYGALKPSYRKRSLTISTPERRSGDPDGKFQTRRLPSVVICAIAASSPLTPPVPAI